MKILRLIHSIIPNVLALFTGARYLPKEFEFTWHSLTHDIFRVYEFIFWRKKGIRRESISWVDEDGNWGYKAFTFEAKCAYFETAVRSRFRQFASVRILVEEQIALSTIGIRIPLGYSFAIAFDAYSVSTGSASSNTCSHTATGSNGWANSHTYLGTNAQTVTGVTYNSAAMTLGVANGSIPQNGYYGTSIYCKAAPSTGAQNVVSSWSGGGNAFQYVASYTGVTNTGIGGSNSIEDTSGTTFNSSLTATGGGWVTWSGAGDGSYPSGVTTGAMRSTTGSQWCLADSNGTVAAGSYAYGYTNGSGTKGGISGVEFGIASGTTYDQTYTETLPLVDTVNKSTVRTLIDVLTLVDVITALKIQYKELLESITLVDTITRSITAVRTEVITLVDTIPRAITRVLTDVMTLVDTITSALVRLVTLTETISLTDNFLVNGTNVIWGHITKSAAAVWTKITKN